VLGAVSLAAGLLLAGDLDFYGTVIAEARGGEAPQVVNADPSPGVVGILTPRLEMEYRESNLTLRLDYGPRIFYRQPNDLSVASESTGNKPLILHTSNLYATTRATSTLTVTGVASFSYGQVDYTSVSNTLTGGQPATAALAALALPPDILTATARVGAQLAASRLWLVGFGVDVEHRRPIGTISQASLAASNGFALTPQTIVRADSLAADRLSARDDLLLSGAVSYQHFSATAASAVSTATAPSDFLIATPEVGWRTRLSLRSTLTLLGGFSYLRVSSVAPAVGTTMTPSTSPHPFSPVGSADITDSVIWARDLALQIGAATAVDYFVDPILKTAQPRGTLSTRCTLTFAPTWTAGIDASFVTVLSSENSTLPGTVPMPGVSAPVVDTTVASVALPVGHRVSKNLLIEFGGRWSDRGPTVWASNFAFHQRQLWLYMSLTATTRDVPRQSIQ
jgi:hypothetical protein